MLASSGPGPAPGRLGGVWDVLRGASLLHLGALHVLQPPGVNSSQPLFKLIHLGLSDTAEQKGVSIKQETVQLRVSRYKLRYNTVMVGRS